MRSSASRLLASRCIGAPSRSRSRKRPTGRRRSPAGTTRTSPRARGTGMHRARAHSLNALVALVVLAFGAVACSAPDDDGGAGLRATSDGALVKDGKCYRGVGVNYFDAFYRTIKYAGDGTYD